MTHQAQRCHLCGKPTDDVCFCCRRPVCYEECSTVELTDMTLQTEGNFCMACWQDMLDTLTKMDARKEEAREDVVSIRIPTV